MAANVEQSKLMAQLKAKAKGSWKRARQVEPKARGQGSFPPNLKNMVAKASAYKFDKTKPGEKGKGGGDPYFSFTGIVVEPPEYAGRRAAFNWFLNESEWATLEENLETLANDIALLTGSEPPEDVGDIPALFQEVIDNEVHFIFHSGGERKGGKAPNLFIDGIAEGYEPAEGTNDQESTDEPDSNDTEEGETEEVGDDADGDSAEAVEDADAEAEADEVPPLEVGDGFAAVIGKDDPHNCTIVTVADDGKHTVEMVDGPNKGKKFKVQESKLLEWIEKPKKPAAKPATKKPAGKTGKKK